MKTAIIILAALALNANGCGQHSRIMTTKLKK
jgi:hypothetical protein